MRKPLESLIHSMQSLALLICFSPDVLILHSFAWFKGFVCGSGNHLI